MSTSITIRHRRRTADKLGFHLYEDVLDGFAGKSDGGREEEPPVYLRLEGVAVDLQTLSSGGATVTLTLPRELASALGLLASAQGEVP